LTAEEEGKNEKKWGGGGGVVRLSRGKKEAEIRRRLAYGFEARKKRNERQDRQHYHAVGKPRKKEKGKRTRRKRNAFQRDTEGVESPVKSTEGERPSPWRESTRGKERPKGKAGGTLRRLLSGKIKP